MKALWRAALAEGVGVTFLVFAGAGSIVTAHHLEAPAYVGLIGIALAHGIALSIAISATMNVSGGHINPAVTIAALLTRRTDVRTAGVYVVAQLAGAVIAATLVRATLPSASFEAVGGGAPTVADGFGTLQALVLEIILAFFLVFAVWGTAVSKQAPAGIAGFGIGLVLVFDILVGGPFTGGVMNPARAFGPALVAGMWEDHWLYWAGPILGGALAAAVYEHVLGRRE